MNQNRIIGGGVILEIPSEKFTDARAAKIIPGLEALRNNDASVFVESVLKQSVNRPVMASDLAFRSGFSLERINSEFHRKLNEKTVMEIGEDGIYLRVYFPVLVERVYQAAKKTITQGSLKSQVNSGEIRDGLGIPLSDDLFQEAVNELCTTGRLIMIHGGFIIPGHSITLSDEEDRLSARILDFAEESGFVPFSTSRFCEESIERWNEDKVRKMIHFLHNQNRLIRLTNKRFISCNYMGKIKKRIENHILANGYVCLSDSQDIMGYGRTMAVPVFEYLDSIGFTRRTGDVRVLETADDQAM
jgi:selenocysteine-specific elongation factor